MYECVFARHKRKIKRWSHCGLFIGFWFEPLLPHKCLVNSVAKVHFRNLQSRSALEKIKTVGLCRLSTREVSCRLALCQQKGLGRLFSVSSRGRLHHLWVAFPSCVSPFGPVPCLLQNPALGRAACVRNCLGSFASCNSCSSFPYFMNPVLFGLSILLLISIFIFPFQSHSVHMHVA